jgi:hypothetical protein
LFYLQIQAPAHCKSEAEHTWQQNENHRIPSLPAITHTHRDPAKRTFSDFMYNLFTLR